MTDAGMDSPPTARPPVGLDLVRTVLQRIGLNDYSYSGGVNGTCYDCPFASEPLDAQGEIDPHVWNDPTEAYFRCSLPGRDPKPTWGEYAPCDVKEWAQAALEALNE